MQFVKGHKGVWNLPEMGFHKHKCSFHGNQQALPNTISFCCKAFSFIQQETTSCMCTICFYGDNNRNLSLRNPQQLVLMQEKAQQKLQKRTGKLFPSSYKTDDTNCGAKVVAVLQKKTFTQEPLLNSSLKLVLSFGSAALIILFIRVWIAAVYILTIC